MIRQKRIFLIENENEVLQQLTVSYFTGQGLEEKREVFTPDQKLSLRIQLQYNAARQLIESQTFDVRGQLKSAQRLLYDTQQRLREKIFLNAQQKIIARQEWKYNNRGQLQQFLKFDRDSNILVKKEFQYDHLNRLQEEREWHREDLIHVKQLSYLPNGQEQSLIIFDANGKMIAKKQLEYNAKGLISKILWLDANGKVQRKELFTYHENFLLAKEEIVDFFTDQKFIKYFDRKGRISQITHLFKGQRQVVETFSYQEPHGLALQLKFEKINQQKKLIKKIAFTYLD